MARSASIFSTFDNPQLGYSEQGGAPLCLAKIKSERIGDEGRRAFCAIYGRTRARMAFSVGTAYTAATLSAFPLRIAKEQAAGMFYGMSTGSGPALRFAIARDKRGQGYEIATPL
jgi:hypothetical protein